MPTNGEPVPFFRRKELEARILQDLVRPQPGADALIIALGHRGPCVHIPASGEPATVIPWEAFDFPPSLVPVLGLLFFTFRENGSFARGLLLAEITDAASRATKEDVALLLTNVPLEEDVFVPMACLDTLVQSWKALLEARAGVASRLSNLL